MEDIMAALSVAAIFVLRIGIPVLVLVTLGFLIDRWQSKREDELRARQPKPPVLLTKAEAKQEAVAQKKTKSA